MVRQKRNGSDGFLSQSVVNRSLSAAATDRKRTVIAFLEEHQQAKWRNLLNNGDEINGGHNV
jgi:hypothetical protein